MTFNKDDAVAEVKKDDPVPFLKYLADQGLVPKFTYRSFNTFTGTGYYCFYCTVTDSQGRPVNIERETETDLVKAMQKFAGDLDKALTAKK